MKTVRSWSPSRLMTLLAVVVALFVGQVALAIQVGSVVKNVTIRDANDKPAAIPNLGKKVIAIFYVDPDVPNLHDNAADLLKAAKLDEARYQGIGVASLADAPWKPNAIIRALIRQKIEKYNSTILTDPNRILAGAWGLGSIDDSGAAIVIGKDSKVYFMKKGPLTNAESQQMLAKIKELMAAP